MQKRCSPPARVRTKVAALNRAQPQQAYSILTDFSPALPAICKICRAGARYLRGLPLSIEPHMEPQAQPQMSDSHCNPPPSGIVFGMMVGSSCGQL